MSTLLIVGAGGHGSVIADAALSGELWSAVCFVDDRTGRESVLGFPVVGTTTDLERLRKMYSSVAVGIGDATARLAMLEKCERLGFDLPFIRHRTAVVSRFASIAPGCVAFAQSAINPGTVMGRGCIINTGATVDHDCELGEGVHVCPGAHLAGNVRVGARSWIGIGASVRQGIQIGSEVIVGAGAAVVSDVSSGLTVVGVPARARHDSQ